MIHLLEACVKLAILRDHLVHMKSYLTNIERLKLDGRCTMFDVILPHDIICMGQPPQLFTDTIGNRGSFLKTTHHFFRAAGYAKVAI